MNSELANDHGITKEEEDLILLEGWLEVEAGKFLWWSCNLSDFDPTWDGSGGGIIHCRRDKVKCRW